MSILGWAREFATVTNSKVTALHTLITIEVDGIDTSIRIGNGASREQVGEIIGRYADRLRKYAQHRAEISREGSAA